MTTEVIAEVGINHNGSLSIAKQLIDLASLARCDYVKFQKRDPDICVPKYKKNQEKIVPWKAVPTTYLQYKWDLEFDAYEYAELFAYAQSKDIQLFASVWDCNSSAFMSDFTDTVKIPSAKITDIDLLKSCKNFKTKMLSTGMSTEEEIEIAVDILNPDVIFHTNSVYPTKAQELHLGYIQHLKEKYPSTIIGYSSHYFGIRDVLSSIALGAEVIEKHITLDPNTWGSDQSSSLSPRGLFEMMQNIKELEYGLISGNENRKLYIGEEKKLKDLRG